MAALLNPSADSGRSYKKLVSWAIVLLVILVVLVPGCSSYNTMNKMSKDVDAAWAQVQVQYQRRADLIPNLVNSVKGYTAHESSTLEAVTNARAGLAAAEKAADSSAVTPAPVNQQQLQDYLATQERVKGAMSLYINAVKEAYPDLKANTLFQELNVQLEGTENRIATERGRYSQIVNTYNVKVSSFPAVLYAKLFGFSERPQFQASQEAQSAPVVEF